MRTTSSLTQIIIFLLLLTRCDRTDNFDYQTEILVVGGGASGISAAIQSARMGKQVLIIEPSQWLGGMLTSAGVSAIDGNHKMPSGIWGEFREQLYTHYGGPENVATGWVSNTLFEPDVAFEIIEKMVADEPNITVVKGFYIDQVFKDNRAIRHITFTDLSDKSLSVKADIYIEATEYGDLLARAGENYSIGLEPKSETGEDTAPDTAIRWSQDLTYVVTLQDYGVDAAIVDKPHNYDPSIFNCLCKEVCNDPKGLLDCSQVLTYGKLPNNKYMINWPNKGNDYYLEILEMDHEEREIALEAAKQKTLSFIYFLQTEAGFSNLGLSKDTYPTTDHFALIPYIRESRRVYGHTRLVLQDIIAPYQQPDRSFYRAAVAVGDYPVDHHRKLNPVPQQIDFPKIPSYSIPYNVMIPTKTDNLLIAEKSISVSGIVNGTTRLQPVVLGIGQAVGAAAALSHSHSIKPAKLNIRDLQQTLLGNDVWIMPYMDSSPEFESFAAIQRVAVAGWMRGEGIPVAWANETRFYPQNEISVNEFSYALNKISDRKARLNLSSTVTRELFLRTIWIELGKPLSEADETTFTNIDSADDLTNILSYFINHDPSHRWFKEDQFNRSKAVTREEAAVWFDAIFKPFSAPLFIDDVVN